MENSKKYNDVKAVMNWVRYTDLPEPLLRKTARSLLYNICDIIEPESDPIIDSQLELKKRITVEDAIREVVRSEMVGAFEGVNE